MKEIRNIAQMTGNDFVFGSEPAGIMLTNINRSAKDIAELNNKAETNNEHGIETPRQLLGEKGKIKR